MTAAQPGPEEKLLEREGSFDGLLEPCLRCREVRDLIAKLGKILQVGEVQLTATVLTEDGDLDRKNVPVWGPFEYLCERCHQTGWCLTNRGKRLMGLVCVWLDQSQPYWLRITDD